MRSHLKKRHRVPVFRRDEVYRRDAARRAALLDGKGPLLLDLLHTGTTAEGEYSFMPVYFIAMMDFSTHPDEPDKFFYKYDLREIYSGEPMTDRVHYYFLELPKIRAISDSSTNLEKFCYAMHNMTILKSRPREMQAEIFELLFNSAEIANFTPEEKVKYEHDMTTERDRRNQLAFSYDKGVEEGRRQGIERGIEQGIEKGIERGIDKGREEILNKMKAFGLPQETIDAIMKQDNQR